MSAVGHPLRRRILRAYLGGEVVRPSASELAELTDQRVGQVAYHLKTLAKCEILRPVRGGGPHEAEDPHFGWVLGVESDWLQLLLDVWAESEL